MADRSKMIGWTNLGSEAIIRTEWARSDGAKTIGLTDVGSGGGGGAP